MDARSEVTKNALRSARLIAVGNRINMQAAVSEQRFIAELERIVGLAEPHIRPDRPTLVVLGELLGLPLAVSGWQGAFARQQRSADLAISSLAPAYFSRMRYYRGLYPGISLPRALLLSLTDTLYRPFVAALSYLAAKHHIYLSASTLTPHVRYSRDGEDIRRFGRRGQGKVFLPAGPEVYNTGFLWGPEGGLYGTTDKVFLTESEQTVLDLTPGNLEEVRPIETELGKVGLAISLDAFTPEYLRCLDCQGTRIIIQNDANDQPWAAPSKSWEWQPQEWLNSVLGSVQEEYPSLQYNICAMQVGNFFDTTFDGQSTITAKGPEEPDLNFVGNEGFYHTVTGQPLKGKLLAVSPWAIEDPGRSDPSLSLSERRNWLQGYGRQLCAGGEHANQYRESVIWADVELPRV